LDNPAPVDVEPRLVWANDDLFSGIEHAHVNDRDDEKGGYVPPGAGTDHARAASATALS
jgi:hypothetical protein